MDSSDEQRRSRQRKKNKFSIASSANMQVDAKLRWSDHPNGVHDYSFKDIVHDLEVSTGIYLLINNLKLDLIIKYLIIRYLFNFFSNRLFIYFTLI
jgi:hypothetical protein